MLGNRRQTRPACRLPLICISSSDSKRLHTIPRPPPPPPPKNSPEEDTKTGQLTSVIHTCNDFCVRNQNPQLPSGGNMFGYRRVACSARWVALRSGPGYVRGRTRREPWEGGLKRVGLERMRDLSVWGLRVEAWRRWRGLRRRHRWVDESCGRIWRGSRVVDILSGVKGGGGRDDCYTGGGRAIISGGD